MGRNKLQTLMDMAHCLCYERANGRSDGSVRMRRLLSVEIEADVDGSAADA